MCWHCKALYDLFSSAVNHCCVLHRKLEIKIRILTLNENTGCLSYVTRSYNCIPDDVPVSSTIIGLENETITVQEIEKENPRQDEKCDNDVDTDDDDVDNDDDDGNNSDDIKKLQDLAPSVANRL
jgi:hypothetical protein